MVDDEDFRASLPRDAAHMDGRDFRIVEVGVEGEVVITDGERTAAYVPSKGTPLAGPDIRIVPKNIEAGWFFEANLVTLTDGQQTAVYVPRELADPSLR